MTTPAHHTLMTDPMERLLALGGELVPPSPGATRRKFDLAHMRTLLAGLGSPEQAFRSVLIAGTNGKGSTAATLASILQAAGVRTGLYTSPHLEVPNERVRVDGELIGTDELGRIFVQVEAVATRLVQEGSLPYLPSFFETMTAIAFLHFAAAKVELAVLEVGLGGRLDATNVVEPLVSVLTDISLDHTSWLGNTIAAIAKEKAGILRRDGVLVTLPQHPEANQAIGEVAMALGVHGVNAAEYLPALSPVTSVAHEAIGRNRYVAVLPSEFLGGGTLQVDSPLSGSHQQRNIALAIATAVVLQQQGYPVTLRALETGIRSVQWPGRLQWVRQTGQAPLLLDAAHNPAGAWTLRAALSEAPQTGKRVLVFSCLADKPVEELADVLFPIFDELVFTLLPGPRAIELSILTASAERTGSVYKVAPTAAEALTQAQQVAGTTGLVVVAGSIVLLGQVLRELR